MRTRLVRVVLAGALLAAPLASAGPSAAHPPIPPWESTEIRVVWVGRSGDLLGQSVSDSIWRQPDGYHEARLRVTFGGRYVGDRALLDDIWVNSGTGCYWNTVPWENAWGVGVTLPGRSALLNVGVTRAIDLTIGVRTRTLELRVQEPPGVPCASGVTLTLTFLIGGEYRTVTLPT